MAQKKKEELETVEEIEVALTRGEQFIEKNQRNILIAVAVVFGLIVVYWAYSKYTDSQNDEALGKMFTAERYFEQDSFRLALNGDPNNPGFLEIIDKYSGTKAANLANYYVGISYLNLKEYDQAINFLSDFGSDDIILQGLALGAKGDALVEKGNHKEALSCYLKAAAKRENKFTTPYFLFKAGLIYEQLSDNVNALKVYTDIKDNFSESNEGRKIDKYIAKVKAAQKS